MNEPIAAQPNNPAARLYDLITQARNLPSQTIARQGWAQVFEVPAADTAAIMHGASEMLDIADVTGLRNIRWQIVR